MSIDNYWRKRADKRMAEYHKDSDDTVMLINNAYNKAVNDINDDIRSIFYKFCDSENFTREKAEKILNSKINSKLMIPLYKKIMPYIKNKIIREWMIKRIESFAYKARITRLEAIKESINANITRVADIQIEENTRLYTKEIEKAYYKNTFDVQKQMKSAFNVSRIDTDKIEEILKNRWSGEHYSKRIWNNTEVLKGKLLETITSGLMSGKSSHRMAMELKDLSNLGMFAAERLIRTEMTYVTNMAELESYKRCGIEKYVFVATLDLRTSKMCREHDGKIYDVDKAIPGENLPPLHPYCRSTTIAYKNKNTLSRMKRKARDPVTNKTNILPENMNYDEWYNRYVIDKYGADKATVLEKSIKNKVSDKKEYEKYKEVLGKYAPNTLKDFQELKYKNHEESKLMKGYYRGITKGTLSALIDYKQYKNINKEINEKLIGIKTSNGIEIKSHSIHFIERIIGSVEQRRSGVEIEDIKNTLLNPDRIAKIKIVNGEKSIKLYGSNNMVTINPDTGNLIQVNPREKVKQ